MSKIEVDEIVPRSGSNLTVGSSGQTIIVPAGATFNASDSTFTLPDGSIVAAKIASGAITADKIASSIDLSSKTVTLPASAVTAHATPFDDNKIVNDISTLALRQASDQNKSAYNTNSQSVDVFQDDTGIDTTTNASRNASEYVSSIASSTDTSVKFLITGDGSNGSTTITDTTANHSITRNGNTSWSTSAFKFGTSSIYFDGNDDYLQMADSTDWNYPSTGWTAEMWYKQAGTTGEDGYGNAALFGQHSGSSNGNPRRFVWRHSSGTLFNYASTDTPDGVDVITGVNNIEDGNWHHLALVYEHNSGSGKASMSVDGTWGEIKSTYSPGDSSGSFYVGVGQASNGVTGYLHGYVDGFKISHKNQYTIGTNFTPPTAKFDDQIRTFSATGNFTGTTITAPSSVSSMGAIITYQDASGTNVLNTDIVLQLSADGGSNYSTATLTALPDFSTGIKMAKVNDLAVTAGTQLKYKLNFANQAFGSKEARIRGVALQY